MRARGLALVGAVCFASLAMGQTFGELSAAQAARLAELRPESVAIGRGNDKLAIRGGDLGRFDASIPAVENLRRLIAHLGVLHDAARTAEFSVIEQRPTYLKFVQLIGGVPVSGRIEVDLSSDGRVLEARLSVVDPARAPKAQPITRERALQIASRASATEAGVAEADVQIEDESGLTYKPAPLGEPLKLQYRFVAQTATRGSDYVTVDALSGTVDVAPAAIP
ncbi:MAG TPA: hypothetical protein VJT80_21365 [Steroidobacteraceae bacterium]|nr:hypothetical protein [Steroidobacteraceae bacterium]